ncbi:ATP-binding cassette domain-containing protein [Hymenobacter gummosus]|uniref:ATP-binding cassette domain-containing protein n=1 Tax=Hymenobacter gummosus TaxID=1776032 RepID=A0A431TZJ7_9BACT|nr:ATP-binding cassette domain-containing protein [Hymenobacter gummosus]RTQ47897.1 ATP-binding cassette domain-containing protein [Hymenobacter gummosus]
MAKLAPPTAHILEADGIRVELPGGRTLLSSIYLKLETGVVAGLLGRNGCGKSTLLQAVFGPRTVPDASVRLDGRYVYPAYRRPGLINYLPQTPLLPAALSLGTAARWLAVEPAVAFARFPGLLARLREPVGRLSGGQQRLAETLLLLHQPTQFTLLDEPLAHLAPVQLEGLGEEIRAAAQRKGLLLTDHDYRALLPLCQRLYLLNEGRLLPLDAAQPTPQLIEYGYLPGGYAAP